MSKRPDGVSDYHGPADGWGRSEGAGIGSQERAVPSSRHSHATEAEPIARRRSDCRDARRAGRTVADLIEGRHDGSSSALSTTIRAHDWLLHSLAALFDRNHVVHRRLEDALAPDRQLQLDDDVVSDLTLCAVPFSYSARPRSHTPRLARAAAPDASANPFRDRARSGRGLLSDPDRGANRATWLLHIRVSR
jgi:hypothetical protein